MKNQVDAMRSFSAAEGVAHFLNSSLTKNEILNVKEDILSGKTKMLYVAPESLTKESNVEFLKKIKISFFAVDSDTQSAERHPEEPGYDGCPGF